MSDFSGGWAGSTGVSRNEITVVQAGRRADKGASLRAAFGIRHLILHRLAQHDGSRVWFVALDGLWRSVPVVVGRDRLALRPKGPLLLDGIRNRT